MKNLLIIPLLALLLLVASCDITSPPRFEGDVYALAGLLIANASIDLEYPIYLTRSASVNSFDPLDLFVGDATITVQDMAKGELFTLQPALHEFMVKYIDPAENIILAGHTYRVEVTIPGYDKTIWAETTVPQPVTLVPDLNGNHPSGTGYSTDPDTENTTQFSVIDPDYPIVLGTGDNAGAFNFWAEVYCREPFSTDLEFTNPILGITNPDESLEPIYNSTGQSPRRVLFTGVFQAQQQPGAQGNYLSLTDFSTAIAFYGRYRFTAYVVDDNYYRYTYTPEGYLYGGVHNGLGYLGSASGGRLYTRVVK
jgi:hypothetical protein